MKKNSSINMGSCLLWLLTCLLLMNLCPKNGQAQSYTVNYPVQVKQLDTGNDYNIKYQMILTKPFPLCGGVRWKANRPNQRIGNKWINLQEDHDDWSVRTVTVSAYPGAGAYLGGTFNSRSTLLNCDHWSRAVKLLQAAPLKNPYNLGMMYEEDQKRIIVKWSNATNVPSDKYKTKIKRTDLANNTISEVVVDGGITSYIDTRNIRPAARFKYEICTHFPGGHKTDLFKDCPSRTSIIIEKEITLPNIIENIEVDTKRASIAIKWKINSTVFHDHICLEYKDSNEQWNLVKELSATTNMYQWTPRFSLTPGKVYDIRVIAMKEMTPIQSIYSRGYISPNGVLSGHIKIADSEKGVPNIPLKIISGENKQIKYRYYNLPITYLPSLMPNITRQLTSNQTLIKQGLTETFNLNIKDNSSNFGIVFDCWIYIDKEDDYRFFLNADDCAILSIDNIEKLCVIYNESERNVNTHLKKGFHKIQLNYIQGIGDLGLNLSYSSSTITKQQVPSEVLYKEQGLIKNTSTDEEGYFYLDEVYYGEEAKFYIIPLKKDSDIRPDTITRTLSINDHKQDNVRFQDHSSIPVHGIVKIGNCPISKAQVVFNDSKESTITKDDGSFEYVIQSPDPIKKNELGIFFKGHKFDKTIQVDLVNDAKNSANPFIFHDIQTDTLDLSVLSGCESPIADQVDVLLTKINDNGESCYSRIITLNNTGKKKLKLPATTYNIKVVDMRITNQNANEQIKKEFNDVKENIIASFREINIDLGQRDTIKIKDTKVINEKTGETKTTEKVTDIKLIKAAFRFRQKIDLDIEGSAWSKKAGVHQVEYEGETFDEEIFTMQQGEEYNVKFKLNEKYDYYRLMKHQCGVDEAKITINDNISDRNKSVKTILDGTYEYKVRAGNANIRGPWNKPHGYQKNLMVTAVIKDYKEAISTDKWSMILGDKVLEPTFITNQLALPEFILHDPPGDESYAFIQKGMSITTGTVFKGANLHGVDSHNLFQFAIPTPVMNIGIGVQVDVNNKQGFIKENEDIYTTTFNESISTTNDLTGTGEDADVIIGSALNFVYSKSIKLSYDGQKEPTKDNSFTVAPGFKTRYVLSVYHVKTKIMPALDAMLENITKLKQKVITKQVLTKKEQNLVNNEGIFTASKKNWAKVLSDNKRRIFTGGDALGEQESSISNLTFSGGNNYDYTKDKSTTTTRNSNYHWEVTTKAGALFTGVNPLMDLAKIEVHAAYVNDQSTDTNTLNTKVENLTTGFHLGDSSAGDYFTLNVTEDPQYKTYVFQTVSGTSSCPNEPNTQARDRVKMTMVSKPILNNLPKGKSAIFRVRLENDSQSEEGRIYSINTLTGQESGATVKIGGKKIFGLGNRYSVYLPSNETTDLTVEIIPGPETRSLNVDLVATPDCMSNVYITEDIRASIDAELDKVPSDVSKVGLNISWESDCDPIQIASPADNWVVNTTIDNSLPITLKGFDPNSKEVSYIEVQYRKVGDQQWHELKKYNKADIGDFPTKHISVNVSNMTAGKYYLRASSYCNNLNVRNYSNVVRGTIDHNAFVVTGSNVESGWLRTSNMTVSFSKEPSQAQFRIERINKTKTEVYETYYADAVVQGYNAIVPIKDADLYEGSHYRITAVSGSTYDETGEMLFNDKSFDIILDRSLAKWQQNNQVVMIVKGETCQIAAKLINNGANDVPFRVVANTLSTFISPIVPDGIIPANGVFPVAFEINSLDNLPLGRFKGEVTVIIEENGQSYSKELQVELIVKSLKPIVRQPEPKQYQMHVVAQFTTSSDANIPLSTDEQDFIVAYIDNEIAGVSPIFYDTKTQGYRAYITVESDNENKQVSYKMWDNSQNMMYVATETNTFKQNTLVGTLETPKVLHTAKAEQYISLKSGWNFISFNVVPENSAIQNVLSSLQQADAQIKHINEGFSAYDAKNKSWGGALKNINVDLAYKLYVPYEDVLKVQGTIRSDEYPLYAESYNNKQYNWIAVHSKEATDIQTAIDRVPLAQNVVLRHNLQFSILNQDKSAWGGTIKLVEPGKGYELYDPNQLSEVIEETPTVNTKSAMTFDEPVVEPNVNNTMTFIGESYLNGEKINANEYTVEAKLNGQVIGRNYNNVQDPLTQAYQFYMLKAAENPLNQIEFNLIDHQTGQTYTAKQTVSYKDDQIIGTIQKPYKLQFGNSNETDESQSIRIYPNPVKQQQDFNIYVSNQVIGDITIEISNMLGAVQYRERTSNHRLVVSTNKLLPGIYHVTIKQNDRIIGVQKLIIH
ncbi:T9SS type A sorting domain-containing protein [Halosquirtibacter xylanolyticus]|uniref:T9SS type A sorting domain-containing protein n=1 Tax=Halosquirtibacter xylanolyticus TaxID=3374599 RepID=UPI003747CDAE|nr:T9SS type A sorting domain-containing protein [Prolixibacteraceae bacterium]